MTVQTATGIKRFQEEKGYGKWFEAFYALVKTRDSCQPEQAQEPSATNPSPNKTEDSQASTGSKSSSPNLFVPVKNRKKVKSTTEIENAISESLSVIKDIANNDPTKEMINFLRDEMAKAREHELKMMQLIFNNPMPTGNFAPPHHYGYQRNYHQPSEIQNNCPQWQGEYRPSPYHIPNSSTSESLSAEASTYYEL